MTGYGYVRIVFVQNNLCLNTVTLNVKHSYLKIAKNLSYISTTKLTFPPSGTMRGVVTERYGLPLQDPQRSVSKDETV